MMPHQGAPQNMIPSHLQQQNPNQMMGVYNPNPQHQQLMMSQSMNSASGMSPHQPQHIMSQYPQQGMSPHSTQQLQINNQPSGHNMLQGIHNQMLQNNPQSRVMSPLQQGNGGMISPHHQMMNQVGPVHSPHQQSNMSLNMQPNNGPFSTNMSRGNMMPQQQMNPGMIPPHPQNNIPQHHGGMMPIHNNHPNMMINNQQNLGPQGFMGPPQIQSGKIYSTANQHLILNNQPNSILLCGACNREVQNEIEETIMCESGCNTWFHRICINMTPEAYHFIKNEIFAEWVCENCIQTKRIAPVKFKS